MFCKNCGKKLEDEYKFCPYCTVKIETEERIIFCRNCGRKISKGMNFCANCGANLVGVSSIQTIVTEPEQKIQNDFWLIVLSISGIIILIVYLFCSFGSRFFLPWLYANAGGQFSQGAGIGSFLWLYGLPSLYAILVLKISLIYRKKSIIRLTIFTLVYYSFWLLTSTFFQGGGDVIFYFLQFVPWGYVYSNGITLLALIDFLWPVVFSIFSIIWEFRQIKSH